MQRINQSLFAAIGVCAGIFALTALNSGAIARDEESEENGLPKDTYSETQQRHSREPNTKQLPAKQAEALYQSNQSLLTESYRRSGDITARDYTDWRRANSAPYPSFSHGRRFLNNYLNSKANVYLNYKDAGEMPTGAIIAKESFAVGERRFYRWTTIHHGKNGARLQLSEWKLAIHDDCARRHLGGPDKRQELRRYEILHLMPFSRREKRPFILYPKSVSLKNIIYGESGFAIRFFENVSDTFRHEMPNITTQHADFLHKA